MHIAILAPIATNDLLPGLDPQVGRAFPKGRAEAPLISNLAKEFLQQGHQVLAITTDRHLDDNKPPFVYQQGNLTYVVVPSRQRIFRPNGRRLGRTADFYRFERKHILSALQRYKPDVVHAHWTYEFAMAGLAHDPNTVITVHDNAKTILTYVRTLERVFMLLMARYVFRRGRWFTAVSPYMAESIQTFTSASVRVVANPVPIPASSSLTPPSKPVITMIVNGWDERKNPMTALLAFKRIQQQHPDAVLWGFGTAFEPGRQATEFCQKHTITNVHFAGPTPHREVLQKVQESSLILHTSLEESFGMVLAEAMSYGIPVVAGKDSGAVPWVVGNGGLLVDVTDTEAVAEAVHQLLTDSILYQRISRDARETVSSRFDVQTIANQFMNLYEQCITATLVAAS